MFTGIIEEIGIVLAVGPGEITVGAETVMSDLALGQSIAIDGVDLTVAALTERSFHANVMAETYRRSTLGPLQPGRRVNLERAVLPTTRLSGHIVRGVVEGTAHVEGVSWEADALILRFSTTSELLDRMVVKGPVAVDGASFTVIARDERASPCPSSRTPRTTPPAPIGGTGIWSTWRPTSWPATWTPPWRV